MLLPRLSPLFCRLLGLLAAAGVVSARAELVYANTNQFIQGGGFSYLATNTYTVAVPDGQGGTNIVPAGQIADSIRLTRAGELAQFRFAYLAGLGAGATLDGISLVLRFYANDGPQVSVPGFGLVSLPGSLLYESNPFALDEGSIIVTLNNLPSLLLPDDLTWAVEYRNLPPNGVSLQFPSYDPATIGSNPGYYLRSDTALEDWVLFPPAVVTNPNPPGNQVTVPGSFPADMDFVPIPEPGAAALAGLGAAAFLLHSRRSRYRRRA